MIFGRRPLTTEFRLLVECCRQGFDEKRPPSDAVLRAVDWKKVVALSQRHRVQGLVWRALRDQPVPEPVRKILSADAAEVAEHNLRSAQLSKQLSQSFSGAGIPLLFVKGLTLSQLAYRDPLLKMGWDVDILVPLASVDAAAEELKRLDFQLIIPSPSGEPNLVRKWHGRRKESVWRSRDGLHVELHTRLADSRDLIPAIGIGSGHQKVEIAPGITLRTLNFDDLFAYLCVHGASSAWFRLKWIADVAALLYPLDSGRIADLYDHARHMRAGRAADQALILAAQVFGVQIGPDLERRRRQDPVNGWLAGAAWNQLMREEEPTKVFLGTLPIHFTQTLLQPGAAFKLREASRQIADWTGQKFRR